MHRLKSYEVSPPGGFPYEQTEGIRRVFKSVPIIESQAQIVAAFRAGNGLPRATVREALEDIDHYQCARLGNHPRFCISTDVSAAVPLNASSPIIAPCRGCGGQVA